MKDVSGIFAFPNIINGQFFIIELPNTLELAKVSKKHETGATSDPVKEYLNLKFDPELEKIFFKSMTIMADKPVSIHAVHNCRQIQDVYRD